MDEATRVDMESRLGADFSDVRLHDDAAAKASAAEIGARAYTSGNHVVIGAGGGDGHTLAHELTHVIQQRQGPVAGTDDGSGLRVSDPSDRFEREAETNAERVMRTAVPTSAEPTRETAHSVAETGTVAVQRMNNPGAMGINLGFVPPTLERQRTFNLADYEPTSEFRAHVPVFSSVQNGSPARMGDIYVGDMMISDTDRPQTQFLNAGQKNHTTAWTLMREALLSHSRKSAASLVSYIGREVGNLQRIPRTMFSRTTQGALPLYEAALDKTSRALEEIQGAAAPVSEWSGALAQLVRLYMEAYQLNPAATFGGNSGGNSEGDRMARLRRQESLPLAERISPEDLWQISSGLYEAPPTREQREYSGQHFWNTMANAFPGVTQSLAQIPGLHHANQALQEMVAPPHVQQFPMTVNDELLRPLDFGVLDSGFVADVEVYADNQGNLWTGDVQLSSKERPPTQFRPDQRSHTIAWKAIHEAAVRSTRNKTIQGVLDWVARNLQYCEASGPPVDHVGRASRQSLGAQIQAKLGSCRNLVNAGEETRPQFWSAMLSTLVRGCLTLENSSRMATGGGPAADIGAALGHAEGITHGKLVNGGHSAEEATMLALGFIDTEAMRTQSINRIMAYEQQQLMATGQQPRRATRGNPSRTGVLERSNSLNEELDRSGTSHILDHWIDTVTQAYPDVQFEDHDTMARRARLRLYAPAGNHQGTALNPREKNLFNIIE
ncbi:DUF4157 domain-containing protein [Streptomyces sp. cmx-4-7]|uniref:eCIS core domain-containing protein n=1 Tax=Streptomyces sp. cmx-4-7 TaxID=2790939 RepID=UPI0039814415